MEKIIKKTMEISEKANININTNIIMLDLISETGELSKEILKKSDYGKKNINQNEIDNNMKLELGDVLFSLILLSKSLNVNLEEAFNLSIKKYEDRLNQKGRISSN